MRKSPLSLKSTPRWGRGKCCRDKHAKTSPTALNLEVIELRVIGLSAINHMVSGAPFGLAAQRPTADVPFVCPSLG